MGCWGGAGGWLDRGPDRLMGVGGGAGRTRGGGAGWLRWGGAQPAQEPSCQPRAGGL